MFTALILACVLSDAVIQNDLQADIQSAIDTAQASAGTAQFILRVETSPAWRPQTFTSSPQTNPDSHFRIASNTKSWVAAALLQLVDVGLVDLDTSISTYLSQESTALLRSGGYDPDEIHVRHLAHHTAGLADHAQTDAFFEAIVSDPMRLWTRTEQIALAMSNSRKRSDPGQAYSYSDTGYLLIGEIIERVSGKPLALALRELVDYAALGLEQTWLETLEPAPHPAAPRLRQGALGLDTAELHPSMDLYGGGGLVSTLGDMNRFYRGLVEGEILSEDALKDMLSPSPQSLAEGGYGMGVFVHSIANTSCFGHAGFWGSLAYHCPEIGLTLSGAVTDQSGYEALTTLIHDVIALQAEADSLSEL